jgi:uncharacterized protein (TIGR02145 family)
MKTTRFLLAAGFALVMALTFSCSGDGGNGGSENSSSDGGNQSSSSNNEINGSSSSGFGTSSSNGASSSSVNSGNSSSSGNSENNGSSSSVNGGNSSSSNNGTSSSSVTLKECTDIFNPANKFCYDGVVYDKCNGNEYDPINHKCENSILKDKCGTGWYNPATQFCSGNYYFNKCDGMEYPPTTHICQGGVAVLAICNGIAYNPLEQKCLNNVIESKCGTIGWYNPVTDNCQAYKTAVIGTQTWMAENLNYDVAGSKCYDNDISNCDKYGRLYDWATAMALPSTCNSMDCSSQVETKHRGICPEGWHISSIEEWETLLYYVKSDKGCSSLGFLGTECAGEYLKATSGWNESGNGLDTYGFSALPGGLSFDGDDFNSVGGAGFWWSTTVDARSDKITAIVIGKDFLGLFPDSKSSLYSVRCLKD